MTQTFAPVPSAQVLEMYPFVLLQHELKVVGFGDGLPSMAMTIVASAVDARASTPATIIVASAPRVTIRIRFIEVPILDWWTAGGFRVDRSGQYPH
jgi:hypothetical protein